MNNSVKLLLTLLVMLAGFLYLFSIGFTGYQSLWGKLTPDSFFANAVTVIGGILSTNLGAVLGITLTPPATTVTNVRPAFMGLRPSIPRPADTDPAAAAPQATPTQKFQVIACWVYVGGLLIAFLCFLIGALRTPPLSAAPLIQELVKTLMGVFVGAITVMMGRQ
jgi:hypothetical protein